MKQDTSVDATHSMVAEQQDAFVTSATLPKDSPTLFVLRSFPFALNQECDCLEIALWEDGIVLYSTNEVGSVRELRVGWLPPATVEAVLTQVEASGFFRYPSWSSAAPDAGMVTISAQHAGKRNSHTWDELTHSWFPVTDPPWSFRQMWKGARTAIRGCYPEDSQKAPTVFRGFDCSAPAFTAAAWIDPTLWRPHNH